MFELRLIFLYFSLSAFNLYQDKEDCLGKKVYIAVFEKRANFKGTVIRQGNEVVFIDTSRLGKISAPDLFFWNADFIQYHSNILIHFDSIANTFVKGELCCNMAEQAFAKLLNTTEYIVTDSIDQAYFHKGGAPAYLTLLVYDRKGLKPVGSIYVSNFVKTTPSLETTDIQYLFTVQDTSNIFSAISKKLYLSVTDVKNKNKIVFDSIIVNSEFGFGDVRYFNPRYLRDEGNGKLSYMMVVCADSVCKKKRFVIYEYDFF